MRSGLAIFTILLACTYPTLGQVPSVRKAPRSDWSNLIASDPAQRLTVFASASNGTGFFDQLEERGAHFIFVPTNQAWLDAMSANTFSTLLEPANQPFLSKILGCHAVSDANFQEAILGLAEKKRGSYSFDTIGGCRLTATWSSNQILVGDDLGNSFSFSANELTPSTFYVAIDKVVTPPGIEFDGVVRSSRLFAGPNQFPPESFAAYGIVAFTARASDSDRSRHLMICDAFVNTVPHSSELSAVPQSEQMATVWPIERDSDAELANKSPRDSVCELATDKYGLVTARTAIRDAEATGQSLNGRGPFLLAWSPPQAKGGTDAIVLIADLSNVTTYEQAAAVMRGWVDDIEQNPQLWKRGWDLETLRVGIQQWLDRYGTQILVLFGAGAE